MKGIKKTLCLLLSLVMILSMGVPAFAFDNATSEAQANTTSSETSPFSIELSTDKSGYSTTGIAKITAKVTNTSGKDIKNVSAEAVFTDLAPVKNGQTTAEAETLKDGESLEFTYRATINKNAKKLNIIEKIILFFVRLFNGGYSAKDNGFDNGRDFVESSNDIKFGKHTAVNGVKVWFGESSYFSAKDVENREMVRSSLSSLMSSDEYQNKEEKHKIKDVKKLLSDLEKEGLINNINYNSDTKCFRYYFTCGGMGTVSIKSEKKYLDPNLAPVSFLNKNQARQNESISKSVAYSTSEISSVLMYGYDIESYELQLDNTWKPVERIFDSWTELCNSKNMNTTIIDCPTVFDFKTLLLDKSFICIFEHGNYGGIVDNTYVFKVQDEEITPKTDLAYNTDIYFKRIVTVTDGAGENFYCITPDFFEFYYKNKLTDSIVYMLSCQGFGNGTTFDYGIADTLINDCGAKAVFGFHNSVAQCYGYQIYDKIVDSLLKGFTIGEAYDLTIDELGATDYTFLKNHLFDLDDMSARKEWLNEANRKNEEGEVAEFLLQGDKTARLTAPKHEKITKVQGCVLDSATKAPIANATVEVFDNSDVNIMKGADGTYDYADFKKCELVTTTTTDENGKYTLNLQAEKNYAIAVNCENYKFNGLLFYIEKGLDGYFPADILLVSNNDRTITTSGDCGANVKWVLYDDGELVISGSGEMTDFSNSTLVPWYNYRENIKNITIQRGVSSIGSYAFLGCDSVTNISISTTITTICGMAFYACYNITTKNIPDSVTTIKGDAFSRCKKISSIQLSKNVKYIVGNPFNNCDSLTSITVDKENNSFSSLNGVLFNKSKTELIAYPSGKNLKEYTIPNDIESIGSDAFSGNDILVNVHLPSTLKEIGFSAFEDCDSLQAIDIPSSVEKIKDGAFNECNNLTEVNLSEGIKYIGSCAFTMCGLRKVKIPKSVENIESAFRYCNKLISITINNPECVVGRYEDDLPKKATIYGYSNSTAQAYAEKYNRTFIPLD